MLGALTGFARHCRKYWRWLVWQKKRLTYRFSPVAALLAAQTLYQGVKDTLGDLDHLGGGLVRLLELQKLGRLFIQIHTCYATSVLFDAGGNRG